MNYYENMKKLYIVNVYIVVMIYTDDSLQLQKYIKHFNKISIRELTIRRSNIIKQLFITLNEASQNNFTLMQQHHSYSEVSYANQLFSSIPNVIQKDIVYNYRNYYKITYKIGNKHVVYHLHSKHGIQQDYIETMILKMNMWLYIAFKFANNDCSDVLDVYIFLTDYKKFFPNMNNNVGSINANTAFTKSCASHNEIYIYRHEEWFKVFIHETFHSLGLDFSHMNVSKCGSRINRMFSTNIENLRLYESYCETWSNIIHTSFIAYFNTKSKTNYDLMLKNFHKLYSNEVLFSINQMVLLLGKQNINYENMIFNKGGVNYKEDTNAFAYYVIKTILLFHINDFISWNIKNNINIINFKKTHTNITSYCDLIKKLYQNEQFIKTIKRVETIMITKQPIDTLRMTIYEML